MQKLLTALNKILDAVVMLIFIAAMAIGAYFTYDSAYVYYNASAGRVAMHRPGSEEEKAARII